MIFRLFLFISIYTVAINSLSQNTYTPFSKDHRWFISWGYNRSVFDASTIHFTGEGYDITLHDVIAEDKPCLELKTYFNPTLLTIPQFNFRGGYFLNDKWSLSLGYDHMKYVMKTNQEVLAVGTIDSIQGAKFAGTYNHKVNVRDFNMGYEHTDGLNYISFDLEYNNELYASEKDKLVIDFFAGIGAGVVVPKTNANFFYSVSSDKFHLAGGGFSFSFGPRAYFWKRLFAHLAVKRGYLFMPDIATNLPKNDRASQTIQFIEGYFQVGYLF